MHRNIEDYLKTHDLYYDRRKNHYKNQGKPKEKVIAIPCLAQAVMAALLHEPDNARARPSSLLKRDEDYERVFNPSYPIDAYLKAAQLMRRIDAFLASSSGLSTNQRNNVKFYVAYCLAVQATGRADPDPARFASVDANAFDDDSLAAALELVQSTFSEVANDMAGKEVSLEDLAKGFAFVSISYDKVAKSRVTVDALRKKLLGNL